ncbi:hypothetical protein BLAHAN_06620 [Blautia hansenii DSM 20583]|uniref:Uncharacterized protein n=1 Tax=Blautia hansenii DSM 20583 TaxID=537007 RepID=C9LB16_BLAHA|nr:hypothetical protein BLAHAN_06620 [Blautia hansenii DSM 20583]
MCCIFLQAASPSHANAQKLFIFHYTCLQMKMQILSVLHSLSVSGKIFLKLK